MFLSLQETGWPKFNKRSKQGENMFGLKSATLEVSLHGMGIKGAEETKIDWEELRFRAVVKGIDCA